MFDARKKILILIAAALLLLLFAILLLFKFRKDAPVVPVQTPAITTPEQILPVNDTPKPKPVVKDVPPPPPVNSEEREKLYVRQLSRTFVERMETYSNQNKNRNITDVLPLATESMAGYIETKMQEQSKEYQGVTTRVISMDVVSFVANTSATVTIGAQQQIEDIQKSETKYKTGKVELKKINGEWKVSAVYWDTEPQAEQPAS